MPPYASNRMFANGMSSSWSRAIVARTMGAEPDTYTSWSAQ